MLFSLDDDNSLAKQHAFARVKLSLAMTLLFQGNRQNVSELISQRPKEMTASYIGRKNLISEAEALFSFLKEEGGTQRSKKISGN